MNAPVRSDLDRLAGLGLRIEHRPVDALIPYARNARTHSEAQVALIAGSIREFGFTNPVLVDGENGIIAGHGRLLAARKLGLAQVPVIELAAPHARRRSGRWCSPTTSSPSAPAGTSSCWRWKSASWPSLASISPPSASRPARSTTSCMAMPPTRARRRRRSRRPTPVSRPGDLWLCGTHRVLCGDATNADDVARLLDGVAPQLMVTDPPYGVDYDPAWRNRAGASRTERIGKVLNDDRADWREAWALFPGAVAYVWHGALHAAHRGREPRRLRL